MVPTTRRMLGLFLVVVAAVAAVWSGFMDWYAGRRGTDIRIQDLFNGLSTQNSDAWGSILIAMVVSAVLVFAGIVVWWRWLWALGGLVALATAVLWGIRQAELPTGLHTGLIGNGPPTAACAGALMLVASVVAVARGRKQRGDSDRLSPEWTPAAGTQVGQTEGTSEPRIEQHH